ncbi:MAG: glucodextranase DOMON-like domain-containing protein [Bacillota bacterium]
MAEKNKGSGFWGGGKYRAITWSAWAVLLFIFAGGAAPSYPRIYWDMTDNTGDEYGPGTYQYPLNQAFEPYKGLFDLASFRVWSEDKESVYFDLKFACITNPWSAPEGFIHPVIRIYIDHKPGGFVLPLEKGDRIAFSRRYPWDSAVFGIGWEGSKVYTQGKGGKLRRLSINASLQGNGRTVRLVVPRTAMGEPGRNWNYYVLISSYDGFAPSCIRPVMKKRGNWVFGGGRDDEWDPNIIDMLAYGKNQEKMLSSFNPRAGKPACLSPVGYEIKNAGIIRMLWAAWAVLGAFLIWLWRYLGRRCMLPTFCHWYAGKKE